MRSTQTNPEIGDNQLTSPRPNKDRHGRVLGAIPIPYKDRSRKIPFPLHNTVPKVIIYSSHSDGLVLDDFEKMRAHARDVNTLVPENSVVPLCPNDVT